MSTNASDNADSLGNIERFLQERMEDMEPDEERNGPGRPRILPAMALWAGMLVCVLRGFDSQLAIWRLLSERGLWFFPRFPVTDQAVYKRLRAAGTEPFERIFKHITNTLSHRLKDAAREDLAPFAKEAVRIDGSALDSVARRLPPMREIPKGGSRLLPGKLSGAFDMRRRLWRKVVFHENPRQNDKAAARELVAGLPAGTLILADLGYFGFAWFDWMADNGFHWASGLRAKTSYETLHAYYQDGDVFDGIAWLGAYRPDRAKYAVRLVTFRQGGYVRRCITNVMDPWKLPIASIAELCARRWDIEMAFKLVKQRLKLRLLRSSKRAVVYQQVWAALIISQVMQALRFEIAHEAGVDPFDVSIALLVKYAPQYACEDRDPVKIFVERGRDLGFIRPSRRTIIHAPAIPDEAILPAPPGLTIERIPRYAGRKQPTGK